MRITLICGTNRPGSNSSKVAAFYAKRLSEAGLSYNFLSLEQLPENLFRKDMYDGEHDKDWKGIQEEFLIPASHFIFVLPEYNGSFPGIMKAFIDASDVRACWHNKSACLVGVAAGRAGNLRGIEHFTNVLNHLRVNVLFLKIPISGVNDVLDNEGQVTVPETIALMDEQIKLFKSFE